MLVSIAPLLTWFSLFFSALAFLASGYVLFFALYGRRVAQFPPVSLPINTNPTRFLVLVPAHNEENCIAATVASLTAQQYPFDRYKVVVIADNCNDRTAQIVREMGAEAWERQNLSDRGKGQALRWALDRASGMAFEAVVFIDADTTVDSRLLLQFDNKIKSGANAMQVRYDFELKDEQWFSILSHASKTAEAALFWTPRQHLSLTCFIQGNGFCLSRNLLQRIPWAAYSIVEDIEYSIQLVLAGERIHFVDEARVISRPTQSLGDAFPQRLRWASGTFPIMARYIPKLLIGGIMRVDLYLAESAVALALTSRMFVVYLTVLGLAFSVFASGPLGMVSFSLLGATILAQFVYLVLLIRCGSEKASVIKTILFTPFYLLWLLGIQLFAAVGFRRKLWVRTTR
ncbi:MAG: glycosyl transferase group 2 family protein [Acidobacteriales bacterium]|nr:glycosyl transferase group 2 family protein [Terriglobales bacterium]